jgi:glycosyltransferase involved in cell wall biosynthesis
LALNIWFVNPFYGIPGESLRQNRYSFLATMLADRGHKVTWWSSNFCHATKTFRSEEKTTIEINANLRIILLKTPRYNKNISLQRIYNHYKYANALRAEALKYQQPPDVIIASSPPILAANVAISLAKRFNAKSIIDIQDLWPEAFGIALPRALRPVAGSMLLPLRWLANRAYDKADGISAVTRTFLQRALASSKDKSKPAAVLPLAVDLSLYSDYLRQPANDMPHIKHNENEFWIVYSGTIGLSHDVRTILVAAQSVLSSHPSIRFFITGTGPNISKMREYALTHRLSNVTFTGFLPFHHLTHLLNKCNVGLNAFVPGANNPWSNKVVDYWAFGLATINSLKGELEYFIAKELIGLQYEAGNAGSLAAAIIELYNNSPECLAMGQRARKLAEETFDMDKVCRSFEKFIKIVALQANKC